MSSEVTLKKDLELYSAMLRIRLIEEAIAERYPEGKMRCPVHLSIGQEAIAVGVCKAALHCEMVFSNHRAHAHYLAKGGSFPRMLAEIYGKVTGCSSGRGGSMHLVDLEANFWGSTPIVGGIMPIAVGASFGNLLQNNNNTTILFFGEGSTEEGVFAECLNFASLKKLPILFVCENNLYSVYSPLDVRQPKERSILQQVNSFGIRGELGDGNDVRDVFQKSKSALNSIRKGQGPYYLEFSTYRHREHCGPNFDNHIGYRTEEEFREWEKLCPISKERQVLLNEGIESGEFVGLERTIKEEINEAFHFAETSSFPVFDLEKENPYA